MPRGVQERSRGLQESVDPLHLFVETVRFAHDGADTCGLGLGKQDGSRMHREKDDRDFVHQRL